MKKLVVIILILFMFLPAAALAEGTAQPEYQEVTVPIGHYIVGEDIPAGHWTVRYVPGEVSLVEMFLKADPTGRSPADMVNDYVYFGVGDPTHELASLYVPETDAIFPDGYHVVVNYGPVIFATFTGRPDLGFK